MAQRNERSDVAVLLRTEHAVARVLASAPDEDNAHPRLLAAIGGALGWDFGALWTPVDAAGSFLRCEHTWEGAFTPVGAFAEASRSVMLAPGQGLPGEVWQTGRPAWIADADQHPRPLPRAQAADAAGLRSAFAFPIRRGKVLAVMEFFAAARVAPDDELLATMSSLGSRIGQFVRRCRAERSVRESEARKSAILNAAFDCIITMDGDGRIVEVNAATEKTFGYTVEEMVGQELAAIMIPPGLRDEHRRGLRNYMETGASRIVGHPVELTAMRADGSTFPVELAVTRPELPGAPLFCGYLRDVTERRRAERALQDMAEEQAALRRVATAVAAEVEPEKLFGLVAEEVGRALDAGIGNILRYNGDGTAVVMGVWSDGAETIPVGTLLVLDGETIAPRIWRTHRPARYDSLDGLTGSLAERLRSTGIKAAVGAPVIFAGNVWGAVIISSDGAPFPPEAEFRVADFADLAAQAIANAHAREELAASRMRIVEASDAERRRLERNLHDGAQQRLVSLSLSLRLAQAKLQSDPAEADGLLAASREELAQAIDELRELARGIHPAVLTDRGLEAALETLATRAPLPVELDVMEERLPDPVEAAAYFIVSEALTNVAKYARATAAHVAVRLDDGAVVVEVADDGSGGADPAGGTGLRGLADRVATLDGALEVESEPGSGTVVRAVIPVRAPALSK